MLNIVFIKFNLVISQNGYKISWCGVEMCWGHIQKITPNINCVLVGDGFYTEAPNLMWCNRFVSKHPTLCFFVLLSPFFLSLCEQLNRDTNTPNYILIISAFQKKKNILIISGSLKPQPIG